MRATCSSPPPVPDPAVKDATDEVPALWLLPAPGGEARQIASRPGGIGAFRTAGDVVVFASDVLDGEEAAEEGDARRARTPRISAILHEGYPVRYWDHDLGPESHLGCSPARLGRRPAGRRRAN